NAESELCYCENQQISEALDIKLNKVNEMFLKVSREHTNLKFYLTSLKEKLLFYQQQL
ncbi:MAG: hypothetical protein MHPSP_002710, partial [Paramarteilia canceri]